ncbi:MAG: acyl-CoA dehydrogenase [Acidobacteriota bacterium]
MSRWMRALANKLPRVSETERQALEAGTVWAEGELFSGRPDLQQLASLPYPRLTEAEQAFLDGPVEEVCRLVDPWQVEQERELPEEAWELLRRERFFGLLVPPEHGGRGFSHLAASAVFAMLTSRSMYLATVVLIPNSVGPGELLLAYGTPAQQQRYLPALARGEEIPCFALTEPGAGSDAASLTSRGVVRSGPQGPELVLDFEKRYITLAPLATLIGLAVRVEDPEELLGLGPQPGITCVLVPADAPGMRIGRHHDPMGIPFPNGPLAGEGVVVPLEDSVIGGAAGVGKGWRMLMEALSGGRAISLPAQSTIGALWAARVTGAYAQVRRQFGQPLARFEGIVEPLARIAGRAYLLEAARRFTCGAVDAGERPAVVSALIKYSSTEIGRRVAADAMDVLGGAAICRGPHNLLSASWSASPIGITVEGANILTRTLIVFGQGALRCHPFLRRQVQAVEEGRGGALLALGLAHGASFANTALRSALDTLGFSRFRRAPVAGKAAPYWRRLAAASCRFAVVADLMLLTLGGTIKARGALAGRLADALANLYLLTATLRRFEAEGQPQEDESLLHWCGEHLLGQVQESLDGALRNALLPGPAAPLGWLLRHLLAPLWRARPLGHGPSDRQGAAAARRLYADGEARERLTPNLFLEGEGIERLERAFAAALEVEPLRRKARHHARRGGEALSADEEERLATADALMREAIAVDDFSPAEYLGQSDADSHPEPDFRAVAGSAS